MVTVSLMPALRRCAPSITVLALLVCTGAVHAQDVPRPGGPLLWATVNICDTAEHPDTVGVRGSMPGSGVARERMFMRFRLEYLGDTDALWKPLGDTGDSGWIPVGSGRYRERQAGRNFTVSPPPTGAYRLRATVRFEWRRGAKVTARASRRTTGGHPPTAGADPSGFSAATCDVSQRS
jgi:hypothetical protein